MTRAPLRLATKSVKPRITRRNFGPVMAAWHAVLGERLSPAQQPLLALAFSFFTWRSLTRDSGLREAAAVDTMVRAVLAGD